MKLKIDIELDDFWIEEGEISEEVKKQIKRKI